MSKLTDKLRVYFQDKETRHIYVDEFLNEYIGTQIKVLREQRGWSQEKLAYETGMKQSRISVLEDVNYYSWSISTLKRLAKAFDVPLNVSFVTFGDRLRDIETFSRKSLERPAFDDDPVFMEKSEELPVSMAISATQADQELNSKQVNYPHRFSPTTQNGALGMLHTPQSALEKTGGSEFASDAFYKNASMQASPPKLSGSLPFHIPALEKGLMGA